MRSNIGATEVEKSVKISVDVAARRALMGKSIEAAKVLLEEMAYNNYHWATDRATMQRRGGKYVVDAVTFLASRMNALAQRLEKVSTPPTPGGPSVSTVGVYTICETCRVQGHTSAECYNGPSDIEHVNAFQGFQPPPQHTSQPTAYNKGWKSYSNPSYKNPNPHPQNAIRPPRFQPIAAYTSPPPPPPSTAHLESMMEQFIAV